MYEHFVASDMPWFLAARVEVSKEKRVRCQRPECVQTVWKATPSGQIKGGKTSHDTLYSVTLCNRSEERIATPFSPRPC